MKNVKEQIGDVIAYADNQYEALKDADALIIATEWNEFGRRILQRSPRCLKTRLSSMDAIYLTLLPIEDLGFHYESVGRRIVN